MRKSFHKATIHVHTHRNEGQHEEEGIRDERDEVVGPAGRLRGHVHQLADQRADDGLGQGVVDVLLTQGADLALSPGPILKGNNESSRHNFFVFRR